jgi:hypothetical protein
MMMAVEPYVYAKSKTEGEIFVALYRDGEHVDYVPLSRTQWDEYRTTGGEEFLRQRLISRSEAIKLDSELEIELEVSRTLAAVSCLCDEMRDSLKRRTSFEQCDWNALGNAEEKACELLSWMQNCFRYYFASIEHGDTEALSEKMRDFIVETMKRNYELENDLDVFGLLLVRHYMSRGDVSLTCRVIFWKIPLTKYLSIVMQVTPEEGQVRCSCWSCLRDGGPCDELHRVRCCVELESDSRIRIGLCRYLSV